jgi:hypothetical protein
MKRLALHIAILTAATLISVLPALAAEGMGNRMMDQDQQGQKDECLLMSKNCGEQIDSIQQRITRISHEIGKGSAVYTRDELRHLDFQLRDANQILEQLTGGGA